MDNDKNTIKVLNCGYVTLVDVMGSDQSIVDAARVSVGGKKKRSDSALIDYLLRHEHMSPFEMVEFKFKVKAPIFVARQWFRHRTASVNEISARYSELPEEYYIPDEFRKQDTVNKQGSRDLHPLSSFAAQLAEDYMHTGHNLYRFFLDKGIAREQARIVLPVSECTEFIWKQDLRNLLHFLELRLDQHAQAEIREFAQAILHLIVDHVPQTISAWTFHRLLGAKISVLELKAAQRIFSQYPGMFDLIIPVQAQVKDGYCREIIERYQPKEVNLAITTSDILAALRSSDETLLEMISLKNLEGRSMCELFDEEGLVTYIEVISQKGSRIVTRARCDRHA